MVKRLIQKTLNRLGYEIREQHDVLSCLSQVCNPQTVFDVGVGYGTYPLYEAFPEARFILVEPLRNFENTINRITARYNCEVFYKAVSNAEGTGQINIDTNDLEKSSFDDRTPLTSTGNRLEKQQVEVTTLDMIFEECADLKKPILLKIDTEGHELKVLQGSRSLLRVTDTVIMEVSIAKRFEDSYEFEDLLLFMKENGFSLFTFLDIIHARGELQPRFADIVFKRREAATDNGFGSDQGTDFSRDRRGITKSLSVMDKPVSGNIAISVIIRTVNRGDRLREALESLANQTLRNFEAVVVDMSGGEAVVVLDDYQNRLHIQHLKIGKPLSRAEALNHGILHAAADKIAILDDDNLYSPTHLEIMVKGLEQIQADLVYTGVRRTTYTSTGELIDVDDSQVSFDLYRLFFNNYIYSSGTAFWKRIWERVGGYDPRFIVYEDYDFLLRVATMGKLASLPQITAESRSFTGIPGRQNHTVERAAMRRCRAGIYWKHKHLFRLRDLRRYAQLLRATASSGPYPEIRFQTAWLLPARLGKDLIAWWYSSAFAYLARKSSTPQNL
jgi:FkbM family methyltransferase